jgi:hypothetical protein
MAELPEIPNLTQVTSVAAPGIIMAAVLAFFLWPPRPIDLIPVVTQAPESSDTKASDAKNYTPATPLPWGSEREQTLLKPPEKSFGSGCGIDEYRIPALRYGIVASDPPLAQSLQLALEQQRELLSRCLTFESAQVGREKTLNESLARDESALEKERDQAVDAASQYENASGAVIPPSRIRVGAIEKRINSLRGQMLSNEQTSRRRGWRIAELTRLISIVEARLKDPERLRPEQQIGDYLKAISDHLTAFASAAAVIGLLLDALVNPIGNAALYSALFKASDT